MNIGLTLKRLWRRWYILVPGFVLAAALAFGAWEVIPPKYERTATQLLLPGNRSLPDNANPYYYLGGLTQAADVLVRALSSDNVMNEVERQFPGAGVQVTRDPSTSGPVVYIVVSARSDEQAAQVMELMVERTATELDALQSDNRAARADKITIVPVSIDQQSTLRQREKLVSTVAVFGFICALTVLVAALVEGLSIRAETRSAGSSTPHPGVGRAAKRPNHAGSPSARRYGRSTSTSRRAAATRHEAQRVRGAQPPQAPAGEAPERAPAEVLEVR